MIATSSNLTRTGVSGNEKLTGFPNNYFSELKKGRMGSVPLLFSKEMARIEGLFFSPVTKLMDIHQKP